MNKIEASAHCDGPCGVYDPASARVAAEAVQSMPKKMLTLSFQMITLDLLTLEFLIDVQTKISTQARKKLSC